MHRDSAWHRFVQWLLPWYHEDEVIARHAHSRDVALEAGRALERAAQVTTGVRQQTIRAAQQAIADRLDGQR